MHIMAPFSLRQSLKKNLLRSDFREKNQLAAKQLQGLIDKRNPEHVRAFLSSIILEIGIRNISLQVLPILITIFSQSKMPPDQNIVAELQTQERRLSTGESKSHSPPACDSKEHMPAAAPASPTVDDSVVMQTLTPIFHSTVMENKVEEARAILERLLTLPNPNLTDLLADPIRTMARQAATPEEFKTSLTKYLEELTTITPKLDLSRMLSQAGKYMSHEKLTHIFIFVDVMTLFQLKFHTETATFLPVITYRIKDYPELLPQDLLIFFTKLIAAGVDPNAIDDEHRYQSPLVAAVMSGQLALIPLLLQPGAKLEHLNNSNLGEVIVQNNRGDNEKIIKQFNTLIAYNVPLSLSDLTYNGDDHPVQIYRLVARHQRDVIRTINRYGNTILTEAAHRHMPGLAQFVLAELHAPVTAEEFRQFLGGCNPNAKVEPRSVRVLQLLIKHTKPENLPQLLQAGIQYAGVNNLPLEIITTLYNTFLCLKPDMKMKYTDVIDAMAVRLTMLSRKAASETKATDAKLSTMHGAFAVMPTAPPPTANDISAPRCVLL